MSAGGVIWVSLDCDGVRVWWPAQLEVAAAPGQAPPVTVTLFGDAAGAGELMHQLTVAADELRAYEWTPPAAALTAPAADRRARALREAAALAAMVNMGVGAAGAGGFFPAPAHLPVASGGPGGGGGLGDCSEQEDDNLDGFEIHEFEAEARAAEHVPRVCG